VCTYILEKLRTGIGDWAQAIGVDREGLVVKANG